MTLQFHNTATRQVEPFTANNSTVMIYTCGPTVYDYLHIGNWAAYIYWDTLIRTLKANGYAIERVMNITDVGHLVSDADDGEDKLEKGARREGKTAWQIAEFYTNDFLSNLDQLNILPPDHIAKATDYIQEQLELVRTLKKKGYTYQIRDGIYFDTAKFPRYAEFARLNLDELQAGARVEVNHEKRNLSDFALWKFTPEGVTRDMEWDTPSDLLDAGLETKKGFPGWHLECSAIAMELLGDTLDIHTGGIDHIPVHHTNEIAQSEAATGEVFSRFWLHNNHMKVDGSKISKSLGNGYTLSDIISKGFDPLDFRLLVLQSQYQSEANFNFESLAAAKNRRNHWRSVAALRWQTTATASNTELDALLSNASVAVLSALSDNLNTPEALRCVDEAFSHLATYMLRDIPPSSLIAFLQTIDHLLGLALLDSTPDIPDEAKSLITTRESARAQHDWAEADHLRAEIMTYGIAIDDKPSGSIWYYA